MSLFTLANRTDAETERRPFDDGQPSQLPPVKAWAAVGAVVVALLAYSITKWIAGGHVKSTPTGPTPVPTFMSVGILVTQALLIVACLVVLWRVVIKPWRRDGRPSFDALFAIGITIAGVFNDPVVNYISPIFTWNAKLTNLGCYQCYYPGWMSPSRTLAEPIFWAPTAYFSMMFLLGVWASTILRGLRRRLPYASRVRLLLILFVFMSVFDIPWELLMTYLGIYVMPSAEPHITIFAGHYYQLPLYETLASASWITLLGAARYFRNDKGETLAERGLSTLKATPVRETILRVLAITGMTAAIQFVTFAPWFLVSLKGPAWPADVVNRSYLTTQICGPGTDYLCPGPNNPIPRNTNSTHLTPSGQLVVPHPLPTTTP